MKRGRVDEVSSSEEDVLVYYNLSEPVMDFGALLSCEKAILTTMNLDVGWLSNWIGNKHVCISAMKTDLAEDAAVPSNWTLCPAVAGEVTAKKRIYFQPSHYPFSTESCTGSSCCCSRVTA
jgi:hypothetical protein